MKLYKEILIDVSKISQTFNSMDSALKVCDKKLFSKLLDDIIEQCENIKREMNDDGI